MIGRIRLASLTQITVMTVAWLGICLGIDFAFNPHMQAGMVMPPPANVPLSLHFHHLRCKGCAEDIETTLKTLPWLKDAPMTVRTTDADTSPGDFAGWLDITVADISQIDFIPLDLALRQEGFVASQMELGGLRHFRLEGMARHLCCPTCQDSCERLPDLGKVKRSGDRLRWLDSLTTDGTTVVFHAKFQQPGDHIDVKELFTAMDEFGLFPSSLKVVAQAE